MNVSNPHNRVALVAIDPGRNLGWSVFIYRAEPPVLELPGRNPGWLLRAAGLVCSNSRGIDEQATATRAEVQKRVLSALWAGGLNPSQYPLSVCELMEWRPDDQRSNAQDLIRVATVGAAVAGMVSPDLRFVTPNDWKGQVPKEVMFRRVEKLLTSEEMTTLLRDVSAYPVNLRHNVYDAVGIGLYATGRMARGGQP